MRSFTRRSARVEAMRLDDLRALYVAHQWARAHGIAAYPAALDSELHIWGSDGTRMTARLGQWLAYNPDTGEFTVWDEEQFRAAHSEVEGVAK